MKNNRFWKFIILVFIIAGCGGSDYKKNPVDILIRDMAKEPTFTIVLYDMDAEGTFSTTYKHQYQIITEKDSTPVIKKSDWYEVSEEFFKKHENDMGMEIASKTKDGKIHKQVSPAGFSNYVGNSQYGQWKSNSSGNSFWEFYGKFAMMSSLINLATMPIGMSMYNDYNRNYMGAGRSYYGPTTAGRTTFGTNSAYMESSRPTSAWKSKVQSRVSRSTPRYSSGSSSSSGSRSGSTFRSRSGGGGK